MLITNMKKGVGDLVLAIVGSVVGFFLFTYGGLTGKMLFIVLGGIVWAIALIFLVQSARLLLLKGKRGKP